jgi:hypothetical protein
MIETTKPCFPGCRNGSSPTPGEVGPPGLAAAYLGSARPRQTTVFYLLGAMLMSTVIAVAVVVLLRNVGLSRPHEHTPRYGPRLRPGLLLRAHGAALLVASIVVAGALMVFDGSCGLITGK